MRYSNTFSLSKIIGSYSLLIGIAFTTIVVGSVLSNRTGAIVRLAVGGVLGALFTFLGIMLFKRRRWARVALSVTLHIFLISLVIVAFGAWDSYEPTFTLFAIGAMLMLASSIAVVLAILHNEALVAQLEQEKQDSMLESSVTEKAT